MFAKEIATGIPATARPRSVHSGAVQDVITQASSAASPHFPSPTAWEDQLLYFLLPDRFSNGEEDGFLDADGKPVSGTTQPFTKANKSNAVATPKQREEWEKSGAKFQGGTIKGIESKLGYLKRLGVTAVWVGPIFKQVPNDAGLYHGYAVQDFLNIDPHFGTPEDLRDLVQSAHALGIYVILDIILNHCGNVFEYKGGEKRWNGSRFDVQGFRDSDGSATLPFQPLSPDTKNLEQCAIWPAELQNPKTFSCEGAISNWDYPPEYIRGDFLSLKDIDLGPENPDGFVATEALQVLITVYKYWIAYADLDGYRIDTVKHMGDGPTRHLCTALHEYASTIGKENFLLVGEVTGGRAFETVEATGLDAALGVGNIQQKLWQLPKGNANPSEYFDLFKNATYLKKGTNAWMRDKLVTMIDDHDQVWRWGSVKGRFCSEGEGDRLALAALALNLTTLGIPCIYYGTEQLFDGQGDNDRYIRETMFGSTFGAFRSEGRHFFGESNSVFKEVGNICALRKKYAALRRGRQYLRQISHNGKDFDFPHILGGPMKSVVAWSRIFADQEIICAINTDTEKTTEAFVTVDSGLHYKSDVLKCIYQWPVDSQATVSEGGNEAEVVEVNGNAVWISIPPSGFAIMQLSSIRDRGRAPNRSKDAHPCSPTFHSDPTVGYVSI
ncbi:glycoside hydrolase family 13 protein [Amniculicola lignicola CBS 123094]|uniref:Glycoside hydrolase family 13 protein n=1 Tax=Amniculicola lignicola CBS 123094 TaxID=1392246 RepID=A0A6A5W380_9PLEO|nr:glycoside hydrolase family 13 protein [Amniculicola lignicola CBS 123094]